MTEFFLKSELFECSVNANRHIIINARFYERIEVFNIAFALKRFKRIE